MPNMSVPYQRPNYALQTLVAEVKAAYGLPARAPEYVTGYKSASNFTGHNADSNGVVHAVDLFFANGTNWTEGRGIDAAEWLRTVEGPRGAILNVPNRVQYIIYRDRIAGHHNGWQWTGSGHGHWDHIHVSTCDLYWGDPAPKPAGDYDTRAPWGFGSSVSAQSTITPITPIVLEEIDMSAEANIRARLDQIVAWENQRFNDLAHQAEVNRNMLAGFVRDCVGQHDITRDQIDARFAEITTARPSTGVELFKGDQSAEVYVYDAGNGFRHIGPEEFAALITAGAVLKELPQTIITNAVGGTE